jgi:hypothetical protein
MALNIARRHEHIRRLTNPLPGSVPYDNFRPVSVPDDCDELALIDFLSRTLPHIAAGAWLTLIEQELILDSARRPVHANHRVRRGERYLQKLPSLVEPEVNASIEILH